MAPTGCANIKLGIEAEASLKPSGDTGAGVTEILTPAILGIEAEAPLKRPRRPARTEATSGCGILGIEGAEAPLKPKVLGVPLPPLRGPRSSASRPQAPLKP